MKTQTMSSTEIEDLFVETAGELAESFSINRVVGQLYALLYISPMPVSLDEMTIRLKISKGSASVNIRILENWNAVKKIWVQGSRKDFYTAESDMMRIFLDRLHQGLSRRIALAKTRMKQVHSILDGKGMKQKNGKSAFYKERLKKIEDLQNLAETIIKFLPKIQSARRLKGLVSLL